MTTTPRTLLLALILTLTGCGALQSDGETPSALTVSCPAAVAPWSAGVAYAVNALVTYQGSVYRCLQAHTALASWTPDAVPALWSSVECAGGTPAAGGQVDGGTMTGGATPPASGSSGCGAGLSVTCPAKIPAWAPSIAYQVGNLVTYGAQVYRCVQSHTSQGGWTPDAVPALWEPVSCGASATGGCPPPAPPAPTPAPPAPPAPTPPPPAPTPPPPAPTGGAGSGVLFSAYKDTSIHLDWNTNVISTQVTGALQPLATSLAAAGGKTITLAFATGECGSENWGGVPGDKMAAANVPLLNQAGVRYLVSTGGAAGSFTCGSDAGMTTFINRWASSGLVGVDFDIEAGQSQAVIADLIRRIAAAHATYPTLRFSLTLATLANNAGASVAQSLGANAPDSFNVYGDESLAAVKSTLGFQGASSWPSYLTVNLMTMDYGSPSPGVCVVSGGQCEMGQSALQAAYNLHDHFGVPFSGIELTPMIGGNDVAGERFTLADADAVAAFAIAQHLAGVHYWSYDRDTDCPAGSASPTCNSIGNAGTLGYLARFLASGLR